MANEYAVITGGGTGIGKAIAYALADKGLNVLINGRRMEPLEQTAKYNAEKIKIVSADVSTEEGRDHIVAALPSNAKVKILIHNAGIITPLAPISELKLADFRQIQAINVEGPLFLTQALLAKLKGGRILHLSSGAAHNAYHSWSAYCMTKAALHMLYLCCNTELQKYDIITGSVRPGVVDTPMQAVLHDEKTKFPDQEYFRQLKKQNKLVSPEDVAKFICYLLFDTSREEFSSKEWNIRDH